MSLISVYEQPEYHRFLYDLLAERDERVNISHRAMPSFQKHMKFVDGKPYKAWYFICDPRPVGACYLTRQNEIGVFVFKEYQKQGYARSAIMKLMEMHGPGRYLANINPQNTGSHFLFNGLGFKVCQHTYELVA